MSATGGGLVLALDQGGHGSRAIVLDERGHTVAESHVPVATRREGADFVEQDPLELVRSLELAAADACGSPDLRGRLVVAAGLATQRSTVVCWERSSGRPLTSAISWQDRRNAAWLENLRPRASAIRARTGLVLSPHYGASKLRWCLDHVASVRRAANEGHLAAGPLASFLLARLLAEHPFVVDPANASRTLLFDPATLAWSPELLGAFGVDPRWLPECVPTRHAYGHVPADDRRIPMVACTGDQSAAAFAYGPLDPTDALVNVGTGAFAQRALDGDLPLPDGLLRSVLYSESSSAVRCDEGTVNGAGSALDWLGTRVALDVDRALRSLPASTLPDAPLFLNGVGGLGAPFWIADFPTDFVGAGGETQQLAAVLESVAFLLAVNLERMRRSRPLRRILVSGGLAACDYLCRALADASGLPVERHAVLEATARGLAFLVAGRPADWPAPPLERRFIPAGNDALSARYARWREEMARRGAVA